MPKKDPNKPKGRKTAYAFFVQATKENDAKAASLNFTDFSKYSSTIWKGLSDAAKEQYYRQQEEDKERYTREMAEYDPPEEDTKGKRKKKDKNLPKRAMSGFMFFSQERRPQVKKSQPKATLGDIAKILGAQWKAMSDDEKAPFEAMAQRDRERYEEEMQQFKVDGKPGRKVGSQKGAAPKRAGGRKKAPAKVEVEEDDEEDDEEEEDEEEEDEDSSD